MFDNAKFANVLKNVQICITLGLTNLWTNPSVEIEYRQKYKLDLKMYFTEFCTFLLKNNHYF